MKTLDEIDKLCKVEIIDIIVENKKNRRHLLEMGLTKGQIVEIKKISYDRELMWIFLRDYNLCISKKEQEKIRVKILN